MSFNVEKDKARFPIADDQFKCSPDGILSMLSWLEDAFNGSGRIAEFPPINPIEPGSGTAQGIVKRQGP